MKRPLIVLLLVALFSGASLMAVLRVVAPAAAPAQVKPQKPAGKRLARRLLFVVVDGLRYDVATDPARMPSFARAMQQHRSAEIWAGQVSMTTSAVLAYGTGQPGRLEQVIRNVNAAPVTFNSWLENAKAAGLRVTVVGDPAWSQMYGPAIAAKRLDPPGVAIDVDFNEQTFRGVRELRAQAPDVLVAHFVTPDHQGHAYGVFSERYTRHIQNYDRLLADLLREFGPEWTVIVTSDHGAADTGTHGTDVAVQRRSPIYAYGPGIAPATHVSARLDQLDLAGTIAALLGISAPAHSRGHLLVDWLALPDAERAKLACADAERALAYGEAVLSPGNVAEGRVLAATCFQAASPGEQIDAAARAARTLGARIGETSGIGERGAWAWSLVAAALMIAAALVALGRAAARGLPAAFALLAISLLLVFGVERLPGDQPNAVRVVLFVIINFGVLLLLLWPGATARAFERRPTLATLASIGLLTASYTTNTQPQAFVAVVVGAVLFLLVGPIHEASGALFRDARLRVPRPLLVATLLALLVLSLPGTRKSDLYPPALLKQPLLLIGVGVLALAAWLVGSRGRRIATSLPVLAIELVAVVGSMVLRPWAAPGLGRACIVGFALAAIGAARSGRGQMALAFGVASYVWVSRSFEIVPLLATLVVAQAVARAVEHEPEPAVGRRTQLVLLTTFLFSLVYVQRIGIQGSLDFGGMDWGAGGFGDPRVSELVVGAALTYKYVLAELLVLFAVMSRVTAESRDRLLRALIAVFAARSLTLLFMLLVCGGSYWTALRVFGDLPFGLTGALAAALAWIGACLKASRADELREKPRLAPALPELDVGALSSNELRSFDEVDSPASRRAL